MSYQTDEHKLQERMQRLPAMPPEGEEPEAIVEDDYAPPRQFYIECPECGGVFTVLSQVARGRMVAGVPVPLAHTSFVNREGAQYISANATATQVRCLDCAATVARVQADYGPFLHAASAWFRTADALPERVES